MCIRDRYDGHCLSVAGCWAIREDAVRISTDIKAGKESFVFIIVIFFKVRPWGKVTIGQILESIIKLKRNNVHIFDSRAGISLEDVSGIQV